MPSEQIEISTTDGRCPTWVFTPADTGGAFPAVVFCMDGFGIRPVLSAMAQRLADAGYVVLLPDLFYRAGSYGPLDPAAMFAEGDLRAALAPYLSSTDPRRAADDVGAVLDYLDERPDVRGPGVGLTGYCMGGAIAITVAATYPERVRFAASFHGGGLASEDDLSPHRVVDRVQGHLYIGAADNDHSYPPDMAGRLCAALMAASIDHRHDLYVGAAHGWTMADFTIYDEAAAERHWAELLAGLSRHLRVPGAA